ncbi:MAG: peroxiredoxin [Pseudomonadota bacterium]|nr:MAG: peroxiredoxin [Pseudomonadota bacterium]
MLQPGQPAPQFVLPDADMESVDLARFKGKKNVVLYFYPKAGTPGCTLQAIEFSDLEPRFAAHDCVILAVSCDDCLTHAEFRDENGLAITLLSDEEGQVCRAYGVMRDPESGNGRGRIQRSTFIIDKAGRVRHALYGVNPKGHAAEVLALVEKLNDENR